MTKVTSITGRIVILVVVVAILTVQLFAMIRVGNVKPPGFNSDNVAQQTILSEWQRGMHGVATFGDDNWYLKFPLYEVMNRVQTSPELRASITSWMITVLTSVGAILSLWLLAATEPSDSPRRKLTLMSLSVAAIVSLSSYSLYVVSRINERNIEIPILMLLICGLVAYDKGRIKRLTLVAVSAIALAGLLMSDDPMFIYIAVLPMLGSYAVRMPWLKDGLKGRSLRAIFAAVAAVALALALKALLPHIIPIVYYAHPQSFANLHQLIGNLGILLTTDLAIVNADFWGQSFTLSTVVMVINLVTLIASLVVAGCLVVRGLLDRRAGSSQVLIGALPFWIIFVVTVSNFNANIQYLILLPFALAMALVLAAARGLISLRMSGVFIALLLFSAATTTVADVWQLTQHRADQANVEQNAISNLLHANHLTKGAATYWRAGITSYMSDYYADVANIDCSNRSQMIKFDDLLSDKGILAKPATNFFVLYYPTDLGGYTECNIQTITHQLGTPSKILQISTSLGGKIAVYNQDVSSRINEGN